MKLPAARPRGIFLKTILRLWVVIPAEAGIQANKKYWIPHQVRNDGKRNSRGNPEGIITFN
jgi:hypothetical protein